jgi:hypothetical protein
MSNKQQATSGEWLTNTYDPEDTYASQVHCYMTRDFSQRSREWQEHLNWISKHDIGLPKATETYSVEQLQKMRMVGIYRK